jgi:hypothetical protein
MALSSTPHYERARERERERERETEEKKGDTQREKDRDRRGGGRSALSQAFWCSASWQPWSLFLCPLHALHHSDLSLRNHGLR